MRDSPTELLAHVRKKETDVSCHIPSFLSTILADGRFADSKKSIVEN